MHITTKQRIAMACIVLAGLLGGAAVLLGGRPAGGQDAAQDPHAEHEEHAEHAEGPEPSERDPHKKDPRKDEDRRIALSDAQVKAAGIAVQAAGPALLRESVSFQGEIRFNDDRTAHVVPRLAGVAEQVPVTLGQVVRPGQVLAVIASPALAELRSELLSAQKRRELALSVHEREQALWQQKISAQQDYQQAQGALHEADIALQNARQKLAAVGAEGRATALNRLELRAPFAGTVVEKHLSLGEAVKEDASIFTVADLRTVWAEFAVAPQDLARVRVGQRVVVSSSAFDSRADGQVSYVGALLGEQTRTARARVTLDNPQGAWRPGLFATVSVLGEPRDVPVAVSAEAVQSVDNQPTVFVAVPGGFVARRVKTGRSDGQLVEVLEGLRATDQVAATHTFVLKSELGKAGAEHAH